MRDEALLRHLDGPSDASPASAATGSTGAPVWILTVTQRLAFTLNARVAELRAARGVRVAETPLLRSLDAWLDLLGREVLAKERRRVLLSAAAEQLLWERVIAGDPGDLPGPLLDTASLAATAQQAWMRVCLWGEPSWSGPMAEDVEAFHRWLPRFRARLDDGGFVTSAELAPLVAGAIRSGQLDGRLPSSVFLLGFEKHDPRARLLAEALAERGATVRDCLDELDDPDGALPAESAVQVSCAATPAAELRGVAVKIRERLLAQPDLRIGVLAPDVRAFGARLERVFEEELDPASVLDCEGQGVRRFDFSEAPALAEYPLVAVALDVLSAVEPSIPFETASRILLSDHPRDEGVQGDGERERILRGEVEARLRRERTAVLHLAGRAGSIATTLRASGLAIAAKRFEDLAVHTGRRTDARRSPSRWRREWIERLALAGWPGAIRGDVEGLVFRRWRDALDEFAMLETVETSMRESEALARLRSICAALRVQPAASSRSVQVMNLLDAAGLEFDVVFVIGLDATAFPAAPSPNPLLPVPWQRVQPGMPRVSVESERALAERVWSRLRRAAREVHASWSATGERDEDQSPSAFLSASAASCSDAAGGEPWWLAAALAAGPREERPAGAPGPPQVRSGSPSILQFQSDCAFRAFAAIRLGAERLEKIQPQPDAARRGTLVHAALEKAYRDIPTSGDLAGLSDGNIADVARDAALAAIEKHAAFFLDAGDLASAARLWLEEMVASWMRYERDARDGSWSVASIELNDERLFPPGAASALSIRFRPDRIDTIEDDRLVILDFKTSGTAKGPARWNGDRPEELQLPLYLALLEDDEHEVAGVAFANLSARDACELRGVAASGLAKSLKPPKEGFEPVVDGWKQALETLAVAYLDGDVRTDPRAAKVCRFCGGHALCRIRESGARYAADADDTDDGDGDE